MLEKQDNPVHALLLAAALEAPILIAGIFLFYRSGNVLWLVGAMAAGAAIMLPAILKFARASSPRSKDPFDASR